MPRKEVWTSVLSGIGLPERDQMGGSVEYISHEWQGAAPDDALDRYGKEIETAWLIRRTEQRLLQLFAEGKLFGTVHTCIGQEFVGVAVSRGLREQDTVFSNHRGHGHYLGYCGDVEGLIGEVMGKKVGVCAGRGGSQHLQRDNYFSNGIQGGIVPVSAGLAMAHKIRKNDGVAVVYVGDGTLGQGALYESMNIASKWELPVVFVCENNLFAQSTCQTQTLAGDICARASAFGIETAHDNTYDWPGLFESMERTIARAREGRPMFHRVDTFRLMAHSKGDDNRPEEYVLPHSKRDPLHVLEQRFGNDPRWREMAARVEERIERGVASAEASDFDAIELPTRSAEIRKPSWRSVSFERERIVHSVKRGLQEALRDRPEVVVIGEDIESPYGGAFKCTMDLSFEFPGRVRNTPISELAIAGIGNGLALAGMKPVVEIMFGDFMTLTADQWINHAAKFRFMFNDKVRMPVILRTPMGGKRGYASTHSQSIEKHFVGLPDTQVLCLHHRMNPAEMYRRLFETIDRPTLVVENKILYGQHASSEAPGGFELVETVGEDFPTVRLRPTVTPDVTVLAWAGLGPEAEAAVLRLFEEEEIAADLFLPTRMYPFEIDHLAESLETTRRLIVVEEGQGFAGLGSEVLAQVSERLGHLGVHCRRLSAAPVPIPAARPLEEKCLPGTDAIFERVMEVMGAFVG